MADASTDTPGLLESALAFIKGETVAKSLLVAANAKAVQAETLLATATAKIKDLETALAETKVKADSNAAIIMTVNAQLATATERIATLESEAATAGKRAAQILAKVGVEPVGQITGSSATQSATDFASIVAAQIKAGKTQADAVQWTIRNHPKEYAEARKTNIKL